MKAKRYTISMKDSIMNQVDQMAADDGMTRSGFIAYLIRKETDSRRKQSSSTKL
jgi:metal-responsive CopG/Arc/MetJ family transcriptional regulator